MRVGKTPHVFKLIWWNLPIGSQAANDKLLISFLYLSKTWKKEDLSLPPIRVFHLTQYITFAYYCRRLACVPLLFPGQLGSEYSKLQLVLLWLGVFAVWGCMWAWVYFILRNKRSVRYVTECYRSTKPAAFQVGLSKLIAFPVLGIRGLMKNSLSKSGLPVLHACKCG